MIIQSMTGYGSASIKHQDKAYLIEIKSVNSKMADIRVKLPPNLIDKEFAIKKTIQDATTRGRIEMTISSEGEDGYGEAIFNKSLFGLYFKAVSEAAKEQGLEEADVFSAVMRIPSLYNTADASIPEDEWQKIALGIEEALDSFNQFRLKEGGALALDMQRRVLAIKDGLQKIAPFEENRITKIKDRIRKNLEDLMLNDKVDQNRFEQEIIYYLERIDITEEKIRLNQHIEHFLSELESSDVQVGKVLGFIGQEIGREINTIGSKAQDADMQQLVVYMKDELEKVKEQLANIL